MKKVLLLVFLALAAVSGSMKAQTWSELGPELSKQVNSLSGMVTASFEAQGIPATVSSNYNSSQKSVDININFGDLDIIPYIDNSMMQQMKEAFLVSFIDSSIEQGGLSELKTVANIMKKDGGTMRIVLKGAGQQKSTSISGSEILSRL